MDTLSIAHSKVRQEEAHSKSLNQAPLLLTFVVIFSLTAVLRHVKALISFQDGTENSILKVAESKIKVKVVKVGGIILEPNKPFKREVKRLLEHKRSPAAF